MKTEEQIKQQYGQLKGSLHERSRRLWAASEALVLGRGGIAAVSRATGFAPSTIGKGKRELREVSEGLDLGLKPGMIRKPGAGRKKIEDTDPTIIQALEKLIEPVTRGDPESRLRWTCKSLRNLAESLAKTGHQVCALTVGRLLKDMDYSLQANRKTEEGGNHPDRDAQFEYINAQTTRVLEAGNPAISVDTKKKELVGNYRNAGQEWLPQGKPTEVNVYDFIGELGKAVPYGVYDIGKNEGWVNVGISSDTAELAVESIARWWMEMGSKRYRRLTELFVTADCGGSNSYRTRLWKVELQNLADLLGAPITVCHFPPGTSKWNKIEHRLFSFITMNWRGKPLTDYLTIVNLISSTKTSKGLHVQCRLDQRTYEKGRIVTDEEMAMVNIKRHEFHGEWNYTINPW
jgi:hypothetical protein